MNIKQVKNGMVVVPTLGGYAGQLCLVHEVGRAMVSISSFTGERLSNGQANIVVVAPSCLVPYWLQYGDEFLDDENCRHIVKFFVPTPSRTEVEINCSWLWDGKEQTIHYGAQSEIFKVVKELLP